MSTMNSEIYAALIDAGSSEEKARTAVVSVTYYERDIHSEDLRSHISDDFQVLDSVP